MVRPRDKHRDIKGRFICSSNNTLVDIFGYSEAPITNPTRIYLGSTTRRGEIATN